MTYNASHTHTTLSGRALEFMLTQDASLKRIFNALKGRGNLSTAKVSTVLQALLRDRLIMLAVCKTPEGAKTFCDETIDRIMNGRIPGVPLPELVYCLTPTGIVLATLIRLERIAILHVADRVLINQIAKARKETAELLCFKKEE